MTRLHYLNRRDAGAVLADELLHHNIPENTVILALTRCGVPVAPGPYHLNSPWANRLKLLRES